MASVLNTSDSFASHKFMKSYVAQNQEGSSLYFANNEFLDIKGTYALSATKKDRIASKDAVKSIAKPAKAMISMNISPSKGSPKKKVSIID
jgi:hypothetical protein